MNYTTTVPGVYKLTNTITGKIYVGSSSNMGHRWYKHFQYPTSNNCTKLRNAILKYGKDAFIVEVLEVVPDTSTLIEREQYYLDLLQPYNDVGMNIRRIAGSNLGVKHTDEVRQAQSERRKGTGNPMWGRSNRSKAKRAAEERSRGQKRTPEQRSKMGREGVPVLAYTKTGVFVKRYSSQREAIMDVKGDATAMWKCLSRLPNFNSHKGFIWRYESELIDSSRKPSSLYLDFRNDL